MFIMADKRIYVEQRPEGDYAVITEHRHRFERITDSPHMAVPHGRAMPAQAVQLMN